MIDTPDYEGFSRFMRDIKKWCLSKNCAFVLICQQNRQSAGDPANSGMKGSGSIEEVSDLIILLNYPYNLGTEGKAKFRKGENEYPYNNLSPVEQELIWKTYFEISISKNKNGAIKQCLPVEYYGQNFTFRDWSSLREIITNYSNIHVLHHKKGT